VHPQGKAELNEVCNRKKNEPLLYTNQVAGRNQAQAGESQIKRWSRNKKQALIDGNLEELRRLNKPHGQENLPILIWNDLCQL